MDLLESFTLEASIEETGVIGEMEDTGEDASITRSLGEERGLLIALSVGGGEGARVL